MSKGFNRAMGAILVGTVIIIAVPGITYRSPGNRREMKTRTVARNISVAIEIYANEYGKLPPASSESGNAATIEALKGANPNQIIFLESDEPLGSNGDYLDPWGQPFQVIFDETEITVHSYGKNKQDDQGEKDDVVKKTQFKRSAIP